MKRYMVKPGSKVDLEKWDPDDRKAFRGDKDQAQVKIQKLDQQLDGLQELLYAEHKHKVRVVHRPWIPPAKTG